MTAPLIRLMGPEDIDAVVTIEQESFSTPWSRVAFENEVGDNQLAHYLVVDVGGRVVGYAGMWLILDEAHVTNVAVLPDYRCQGVGRQLMTTLLAHAKALGATCMTLEVRVSNAAAQRLYTGMGFVLRGLRRQYYTDTREDALIMWRENLEFDGV